MGNVSLGGSTISMSGGTLTASNDTTGFIRVHQDDWATHNITWDYYPTWDFHSRPSTDKTAIAFRIVKKLMDKKVVQARTVKQFVDLVDAISSEL